MIGERRRRDHLGLALTGRGLERVDGVGRGDDAGRVAGEAGVDVAALDLERADEPHRGWVGDVDLVEDRARLVRIDRDVGGDAGAAASARHGAVALVDQEQAVACEQDFVAVAVGLLPAELGEVDRADLARGLTGDIDRAQLGAGDREDPGPVRLDDVGLVDAGFLDVGGRCGGAASGAVGARSRAARLTGRGGDGASDAVLRDSDRV